MRRSGLVLFMLISVGFSAFLLVSALLISAEQTEISQKTVETESRIMEETLRMEHLVQEKERRLSLSEIDRYAKEKLKMQTPKSGQIIYIDLPGEG